MKNNRYINALLLAGGLGLARPVAAQRSDWQWQVRLAAPSNTPSLPGVGNGDVRATADGGVLASGSYKDYLALGAGRGDTLRSGAPTNYAGFLAKYSATGQRQWAVSIDNGSLGRLVPDAQGNYVGLAYHEVAMAIPGGATLPGRGVGWLRYSPSGTLLGGGEITRNGSSVTAIDLDPANDLLLSGQLNSSLTIGGQSVSGQNSDGFVARLAPNGAARWVRTITGNNFSGGCRIMGQGLLPNGDVLIGGSFNGTITLDATRQFTASGAIGFLACYNGSTGAVRWARTVSVPVQPLVNPTSGQAYVVGDFTNTLNFDGIAATATGTDVFIARLDAATGTGQALVFAGGGPGDQQALIVAMQADGSVLVSGRATGGASFGAFSIAAPSPTAVAIYLLRVMPQGSVPWLYALPSALSYAGAVATLDPAGNPYAFVTTNRLAVQFGPLPAFTPSNQGEAVLLHGGLVLAAKAAGAPAAALRVYPNPGVPNGAVTVQSAWPEAGVRVCDALGRQVWQGRLAQGRCTVPTALPPGLYLVSVRTGAQQATQRLLVQ